MHVDGVRAHARARRGERMELPARAVTLHRLELLGWDADQGRLALEVHCSSGTYIRSLARDLGERLGCGGCLANLRRVQALGSQIDQASDLPDWPEEGPLEPAARPPILAPQNALNHLVQHQATGPQIEDWRCGRRLTLPDGLGTLGEPVVVLGDNDVMLGLGLLEADQQLRPKVVFDARG